MSGRYETHVHRIALAGVLAACMASLATVVLTGCSSSDNGGVGVNGDENLSYAEKTELAFSNNKILLFGASGASSDAIVDALSEYGEVDATNASAGMYSLTVDGHRSSDDLSRLIDEIVEKEPLIEAGSINWVLPDQQGESQPPKSSQSEGSGKDVQSDESDQLGDSDDDPPKVAPQTVPERVD